QHFAFFGPPVPCRNSRVTSCKRPFQGGKAALLGCPKRSRRLLPRLMAVTYGRAASGLFGTDAQYLTPTDREMPAKLVLPCLLENPLVLAQFAHDRQSLGAEGNRRLHQEPDQCAHRDQPFRRIVPLWLRQMTGPFRITRALLKQHAHRVLIRRKELKQR